MRSSFFEKSRSGRPPLRIGVLTDSLTLSRCFAEILDHILASDFARIELVVLNANAQEGAAPAAPPRPFLQRLIGTVRDPARRRLLLYSLYQRWDKRNIRPESDPLAPVDCSARLAGIESFAVTPITKRFVHRFPPEAIERIRDKRLDLLVRFGFNILRGEILTVTPYGVWSYHHGDNDYYRGGPAYFWEIVEGSPLSGAVLQILTEDLDAGKILTKGLFVTDPTLSHARNRVQPYWGSSTFLIQKLHELHERGWESVERNMVKPAPYLGKKKIYRAPTNGEMARWLGPKLLRKSWKRLTARPMIPHWGMALRTGATPLAEAAAPPDLASFQWIEAPAGRFYADPFAIEAEGAQWLFFEDYDYATQRGRISCAELRGGSLGEAAAALERPYHLSYPCLVRSGDALFMIPETSANRSVELYRCVRFPDRWVLERELYQGVAVDTSVWIEGGDHWFFVTFMEPRGFATQLWLFHADAIDGDWTPHPASPLSTDARNCRGAGAVFRHNGKLYRPSQDCSRNYGYSFSLNEVVALDRERYREETHVTVTPPRGFLGTHSYARIGGVEIIDGCSPRRPPG